MQRYCCLTMKIRLPTFGAAWNTRSTAPKTPAAHSLAAAHPAARAAPAYTPANIDSTAPARADIVKSLANVVFSWNSASAKRDVGKILSSVPNGDVTQQALAVLGKALRQDPDGIARLLSISTTVCPNAAERLRIRSEIIRELASKGSLEDAGRAKDRLLLEESITDLLSGIVRRSRTASSSKVARACPFTAK